ncbi:MAG: glycosyltransferase [Chitinispirillaceae bacterium]|jgi:glycosyltransferase involved in cell wall biosynthesis|nr:glycosyltransferase [Chitinispirillaceae bacterium]
MRAVKINWEGSLFVHHSLGMVNRELLQILVNDTRFDIRHIPYEADQFAPDKNSALAELVERSARPHADPDITVRHRWPPDFTAPGHGAYVLFQPWEYGSLPVEWVENIPRVVREVWVYTNYLRECYIASGLAESSIKVIPLGVDSDKFTGDAAPVSWLRSKIGSRYSFFFNGGLTLRKGIDVLVNAYLNEFAVNENVCLVIKASSAYATDLALKVESLSRRTDIPGIIYLTENVSPELLPSLYTSCDCYVHPYRAEGYGLPIAEAMACARPVIVTGAAAARDFTDDESVYPIKCALEKLKTREVDGMPTVGNPFWTLPDMKDLQGLMRYVFNNQDEARMRGTLARKKILPHTWKRAAEAVSQRFLQIAGF